MLRRHRQRCRRAGGRGLPSRPPYSPILPYLCRDLNLSIDWNDFDNPHPSEHLLASAPPPSPLRNKKRAHKSTISTEPAFTPHKLKSLPVRSATSGSNGSSDSDGNNDDIPELEVGGSLELKTDDCPQRLVAPQTTDNVATLGHPASPRPLRDEHTLNTGMMDVRYVCRILEEPPASSDKHAGFP